MAQPGGPGTEGKHPNFVLSAVLSPAVPKAPGSWALTRGQAVIRGAAA